MKVINGPNKAVAQFARDIFVIVITIITTAFFLSRWSLSPRP